MISEAKGLGGIFKLQREQKGLSLREVESATSIRSTYLEAIEEGNIEKFLSMVYMYGFMRQYALYLNIDIEMLAKDYPEAFNLPRADHEFSYGLGTIEMRRGIQGGRLKRMMPNILWGLSVVAIFAVAMALAKFLGIY